MRENICAPTHRRKVRKFLMFSAYSCCEKNSTGYAPGKYQYVVLVNGKISICCTKTLVTIEELCYSNPGHSALWPEPGTQC